MWYVLKTSNSTLWYCDLNSQLRICYTKWLEKNVGEQWHGFSSKSHREFFLSNSFLCHALIQFLSLLERSAKCARDISSHNVAQRRFTYHEQIKLCGWKSCTSSSATCFVLLWYFLILFGGQRRYSENLLQYDLRWTFHLCLLLNIARLSLHLFGYLDFHMPVLANYNWAQ